MTTWTVRTKILISVGLTIFLAQARQYACQYLRLETLVSGDVESTLRSSHGDMAHQMQSAVSAGVTEMDKFIAEVRQGAQDVERISLQLSRIIDQVQILSPGFEDVNGGMEHQSQQAQEIRRAVQQLSDEMRETYATIEQLKDVALTLQQQVSQFTVA